MIEKMEKVERYSWAKPGDKGERRNVPIDLIKIDHSYQRRPVSDKIILAIARNLSWPAFGVVVLARRKSGDLYCYDGQQRLEALRRRGDIKEVPAIIFDSMGVEYEARDFLRLNCNRKNVTAVDKFRAAVLARLPLELSISAFLSLNDMIVSSNGRTDHGLEFVATLVAYWKRDQGSSESALLAQKIIVGDGPLNNYVHKGLWWLAHNGIVIEDFLEKIIREGGTTRILHDINVVGMKAGMAARSDVICGYGILEVINHRRRNRIAIPKEVA